MKLMYTILFLTVLILPVFVSNLQVAPSLASTNQNLTQFQSYYNANLTTFSNFDVQNVNLLDQKDLFVCFVESGQINYNNFSFAGLQFKNQLTLDDFQHLNLNTIYKNASTSITACQYYATEKNNIFVIYFDYKNTLYSYIVVEDKITQNIVTIKLLSNIQYYQTNKLFKLPESPDVFIEMRNETSLFILQVSSSNYAITYAFQTDALDRTKSYFSIIDTLFFNDTFYILFNQVTDTQQETITNTTVYLFKFQQSEFQISTIQADKYFTAIQFQNDKLYLFSQFDNTIVVYNQLNYNKISDIQIKIVNNFTSMRLVNENEYILRDGNENYYQCYLVPNVSTPYVELNTTLFSLYKTKTTNEEYTLAFADLGNERMYFLAGYTNNDQSNTIGFGMMFQTLGTKPTNFIDPNKQVMIFTSASTSTSVVSGSFLLILALVGVLLLIIGLIFTFSKYSKQKKGSQGTKWKKLDSQESGTIKPVVLQNCPVCGSTTNPNDVFCQNCGNRIV